MQPHWQHFHHGADIGVRGVAATEAGAYAQAAVAMTAVICDPATVRPLYSVVIECEAPDHEILLLDWLNALVYEMATRKWLFSRFEVEITGNRLQATAWGEAIDRARHQPVVEVKGATFTELRVGCDAAGVWTAQCVVDV